jgi:hypothetical protein
MFLLRLWPDQLLPAGGTLISTAVADRAEPKSFTFLVLVGHCSIPICIAPAPRQ